MRSWTRAAESWKTFFSASLREGSSRPRDATMQHFLSLLELDQTEVERLLAEAAQLKAAWRRGERKPTLMGYVLGMVFEKPSLRTRVSFQTAMAQLGGSSVFLPGKEAGLGSRESLPYFARL